MLETMKKAYFSRPTPNKRSVPRNVTIFKNFLASRWIVLSCSFSVLLLFVYLIFKESSTDPPISCAMTSLPSSDRFSDMMNEYAFLFNVSKTCTMPVVVHPEMAIHLKPYFNLSSATLQAQYLQNLTSEWTRYEAEALLQHPVINNNDCRVYLRGTVDPRKLYPYINPLLRNEFNMDADTIRYANAYLTQARPKRRRGVVYVGVTIGPVSDKTEDMYKKFLDRALSFYREKWRNSLFLVSCENAGWCAKFFQVGQADVKLLSLDTGTSGDVYHLAILSQCNHSVIANSTFGFWPAFLANGKVIYFKEESPAVQSTPLAASTGSLKDLPNWFPLSPDGELKIPKNWYN